MRAGTAVTSRANIAFGSRHIGSSDAANHGSRVNNRFEPAIRLVVDELVALVEVTVEPNVIDQQERVLLARRVGNAVVDDPEL
jgi:hypothetical protein